MRRLKRRTLIAAIPAVAAGTLIGSGRAAHAQGDGLTPLSPMHGPAMALNYVDDAADANPDHYTQGSGEHCANCRHYRGGDNARGGCALFPNYSVSAKGWCAGWVADPEQDQ